MSLTPLRPLRFDRKGRASATVPQQAEESPYLPEEEQIHSTLKPLKVPTSLGFASDLKKLETAPDVDLERKRLQTEAGLKTVRPVANRRTGQQGTQIDDVAKILNGVSRKRGGIDAVLKKLPPQQRPAIRLAHILSNLMDEATYQLSKGKASGVDWYAEHMAHMEKGLAHIVDNDPAFRSVRGTFGPNSPRQMLFKALLAPTSNGSNPRDNLAAALRILESAVKHTPRGQSPFANLPLRNPDVQAKDFKTGQLMVDAQGKPVQQGWILRGSALAKNLQDLNLLVRKYGEQGAVDWLSHEHTGRELQQVKSNVQLPYGPDHKYPGSYIFGPKLGAFFQNIRGNQTELTKDMWWTRTWNRILGQLYKGGKRTKDEPGPHSVRREMDAAAETAASHLGLTLSEFQATMWYYEQSLWRATGGAIESLSFKDAINHALGKRGLEHPGLGEAGQEAPARRQAAVSGATSRSLRRHSRAGQAVRFRSRLTPLRFAAVAQPPAPVQPSLPAPPQAQNQAQLGGQLAPRQGQLPPIDEHREHLLAFSPNVDDLSFEDALARSRAGNQKSFKKIVQHINEQIGLKAHLSDAIGDWSDGAENSILQTINEPIDSKTADYLASWYGLLANQKAVLAFTPQHGGLDSVYQIELPQTDLGQVRKSLDKAGIPFRTLIPSKKGTKVVIYDEKRGLRDQVANWAGAHGASIRESIGQGRFIGGSTRTAARSEYRKIITAYESAADKSGGQIRAYRPSVLPNHIRSGQDKEAPIRQARSGQVMRFAVDPMHDVSIPRDTWTAKGELDRMVGAFKEAMQNTKERFTDAIRQAKKPKRRRRKFAAADESELWKHVVEAIKQHGGKFNHAPLHKVRQHLSAKGLQDRKHQDAAIRAARLAGHVGAAALEGRYSSPEDREAAIREGDSLLGSLHLKDNSPLRYSGIHSPAGGVVVRGLFYPGGKWIPSANLEKASYDQYQHVERQRAKKYRRADGSVSVEPALASSGARTTSL